MKSQTPMTHTNERGFIALVSAIIISSILLGLATAIGSSTFFSRFDVLNSEYKRISLGLAEACVNAALGKIGNNYAYAGNETISLGTIYGSAISCDILSISYTDDLVAHTRTYTIPTKAKFLNAFSNMSVTATGQDPAFAPVVPPPTCIISATPTSIPAGQSGLLLQWNTSSNAVSFSINQGIGGVALSSPPGGYAVATPGIGTVTYTGTVTNTGGSNTCSVDVTVTPPPPAPSCADSVMIFDRSGSMSGSDLSNERNAGNALVTLYASAAGSPKLSAGSFGGLNGSAASIPSNGLLTSIYSNITSAISSITGSNSSVGSNLGAAITVGKDELGSVRHDNTKQKVLIFVSDGLPNEPSGGVTGDTGFKDPTANVQNGSGDAWTLPAGAYGTGDATDAAGHRHRYSNFGFNIPAGATITGIEVKTDAWSSTPAITTTPYALPTALHTPNNWSNATNAFSLSNGTYATETTESDEQGYSSFNIPSIPSGSIIKGIEVEARAKSSDSSGCRLQSRLSWDNGNNNTSNKTASLSGSDTTYTLGSPTDTWGRSWVNTNFTNANFVLKISFDDSSSSSCNGSTVSVDHVRVRVYYQPYDFCTFGADLSWNGGGNWSSEDTQVLSGVTASYTLNGPWSGHTWVLGDFSDANFRLRIHDTNPGALCHVDTLQARVLYSIPSNPTQYALDAAVAAKAAGVNIFSIHYGDASGQSFMGQLASPSFIPATTITTLVRTSNVVTVTTSAPHRLTANERVQISGALNAAFNGTFTVTAVPSASTFQYALTGSNTSTTGGTVTPTNLFISPPSSAMTGIFQSIGFQICPAAAPVCSNTSDDDGDGLKDDQDPGCHTDNNASNLASYNPNGGSEWSAPPLPPAPPPPPPPPNITIGSWQEVP